MLETASKPHYPNTVGKAGPQLRPFTFYLYWKFIT